MDKLVPDNILPKMWIIFARPPESKEEEDSDEGPFIMTMTLRMPGSSSTLVPNIFLNAPFYVQSVSLPFITGYFPHVGISPVTYDVYKYQVYRASSQVVSLYKEDYARSFVASQSHSLCTLRNTTVFQPAWLMKTRTYKTFERILYENP